jgi:hypothetical protein
VAGGDQQGDGEQGGGHQHDGGAGGDPPLQGDGQADFDLTLYFEIEEQELLARLAGRAREEHRSDDAEETVRHRLEVFAAQTHPLVDYYQRRGILVRINAVGPVDAISEEIFATLHWHKARTMAAGVHRPEWSLGTPSG